MEKNGLLAIAVGTMVSGTVDLAQACILFGTGIPLVIAAGLLGPAAIAHGDVGTYILGCFLHFFICFIAAVVYFAASRSLSFLKEHPLICGLFYGAAVQLVVILVVLPLSALHDRGPFQLYDLIQGLLIHMVTIGLPISFSVRWFAN